MKERPIIFSAPMVRAILAGKKTQTRRAVKPFGKDGGFVILETDRRVWPYRSDDGESTSHTVKRGGKLYLDESPHSCPYGQPGDRLWVRETWQHANFPFGPYDDSCQVFYRADYMDDPHGPDGEKSPEGKYRNWKPSIHMPRSASRILLEITSVRVERLQDISESDACAEGARSADLVTGRECILDPKSGSYRLHFSDLWEQINGAGTFVANQFVWVIEFKKV